MTAAKHLAGMGKMKIHTFLLENLKNKNCHFGDVREHNI